MAKWSEASSNHGGLRIVRTCGRRFAVVREGGASLEGRRAAVYTLCALALDFVTGFAPAARDGPKHWCARPLTQHACAFSCASRT